AIAAGNSGRGGPGTVNSPGSADAALTVGAVDTSGPRAGVRGVVIRAVEPAMQGLLIPVHSSHRPHPGLRSGVLRGRPVRLAGREPVTS
ncbi:hypothetical protein ACWCY1_26185, partial [Streptomyces goshikiensis]